MKSDVSFEIKFLDLLPYVIKTKPYQYYFEEGKYLHKTCSLILAVAVLMPTPFFASQVYTPASCRFTESMTKLLATTNFSPLGSKLFCGNKIDKNIINYSIHIYIPFYVESKLGVVKQQIWR